MERVVDLSSVHDIATLSNSELMRRLQSRATECTQKSMTARLTAVIEFTEELLARGYGRSQVRDLLMGVGWQFTPDSFDSAISRVRKRSIRAREKPGLVDKHVDEEGIGDQRGKAQNGRRALLADDYKIRANADAILRASDGAGCSYSEIFANRRSLRAAVSSSLSDQDTR